MKKICQKIILTIVTSFYLFTSLLATPATALAQDSTWYNQPFLEWYSKVYGEESPPNEIFGERYTAAQVQWIFYGLLSIPLNIFTNYNQEAFSCLLSIQPGVSWSEVQCLSAVADLVRKADEVLLISENANSYSGEFKFTKAIPPLQSVSGINYLLGNARKYIEVPEANAQGFGYQNAISDLQVFWGGFRDMAYALSVLVIIVFAFMIMFRVKISPQLVISVQSALPKVVIALVLATFSFAIAGFVIDLSYVVGGLLASLMKLAGFVDTFEQAFRSIVPIEATQVFGGFYILFWMFAYTLLFLVASFVAMVSALLGGLSIFGTLAGFVVLLFTIWVAILMIIYTFKVPYVLLKNLISLYLSIVVAPVQIILGVFAPSIGFGTWLKKIIAEVMVFPVTGLFMFLAARTAAFSLTVSANEITELVGWNISSNLPGNMWAPPILGSSDDMVGIIWLLVSFTFIVMIPKVVDVLKMMIMGEKFAFGTAIGEAVAPVSGLWGATGRPIIGSFQQAAGRKGVMSAQDYITAWVEANRGRRAAGEKYVKIPKWLESYLKASPGME